MLRRSKRPRISNDSGHTNEPPDSVATPSVATEIDSLVNDANGPSPGQPRLKRMAVRGKRGKLESISQFPLDVLFELDPLDVLNLSRTSKALRSILMRRSSQFIWKSALAHIEGLPECPSDMTEAALHRYDGSELSLNVPFGVLNKGRTKHIYVDKDTLQQYDAEMDSLTGTALNDWVKSKHSQHLARTEHAERCEKWYKSRNLQRSNELDDLRDQRYEAIKEKLCELGWEDEIAHMETYEAENFSVIPFSEHKLVYQPKVLTERNCTVWNNIKGGLIQYMEDFQANRLKRLRGEAVPAIGKVLSKAMKVYAATQPPHVILPLVADVAMEPSFAAIIEDTLLEEAMPIPELHFQSAMKDFPRIVEEMRCAKDEMLVKMINDHPGITEKATLATLQRAATFFHCELCDRSISYPRILVHECWRPRHDLLLDLDVSPFLMLGSLPWNYKNRIIRYDSVASELANKILQETQLDPATTIDGLKHLDIRFECRENHHARVIMKWSVVIRRAVLTSKEKHSVDKQELSGKLRALKIKRRLDRNSSPQLICHECQDKFFWHESYDHLIRQHADNIPAGYTREDHEKSFERFMTLSLDADPRVHEPPVQLLENGLVFPHYEDDADIGYEYRYFLSIVPRKRL
ncbi:hypothetical protein H0H93_007535 [Arthromyces matolae]|nr:hypothetical protein H0H93_007535 [Arthromyces matolae]